MGRIKLTFYSYCISLAALTVSVWTGVAIAVDLPQSILEFEERAWRVTGTISDSKSGHEIAIIEHLDTGLSLTLRIGEQLGDGYVFNQVTSNVIVFLKGSDRRSIEISRGNEDATPAPTSEKEEQAQASQPDEDSSPGPDGLQRISISLQRVAELLSNLDDFADQVGLETVTDPDGNKSLRVTANSDTPLLAEFGLSDGDILLAANGERVTLSTELLAIVSDAQPGKAIPIAFQREGEIRQISYQIEE